MKAVLMILLAVAILATFVNAEAASAEQLKSFWAGWESQVKTKRMQPEIYALEFAKTSSPALLADMVKDLRGDKSDDRFFAYVLVAVNWNPSKSRKILNGLLHSGNQIDRIWAREFLTELDSYEEAKREGKEWH
jgi:hypothetical protein